MSQSSFFRQRSRKKKKKLSFTCLSCHGVQYVKEPKDYSNIRRKISEGSARDSARSFFLQSAWRDNESQDSHLCEDCHTYVRRSHRSGPLSQTGAKSKLSSNSFQSVASHCSQSLLFNVMAIQVFLDFKSKLLEILSLPTQVSPLYSHQSQRHGWAISQNSRWSSQSHASGQGLHWQLSRVLQRTV